MARPFRLPIPSPSAVRRRLTGLGAALVVAGAVLTGCTPMPSGPAPTVPAIYDPDYRLCAPTATGVPYDNDAPDVNGVVFEDLGWTKAYRYTYGNGSTLAGALQANQKAGTVYLSFEMANDVTLDEFDRVIVVMDPDGTGTNYRMLQIKPFDTGVVGSGSDVAAEEVLYWTGTRAAGAWTWTSDIVPASVDARVAYATAGATADWQVELSFDAADFALPTTGYFGLYTDVIVVDQGSFVAEEFSWPTGLALTGAGGPFTPEVGIPDPSGWGNGSLDLASECFGVYFNAGDIVASPPPDNVISLDELNTFSVDIYNTSVDGSGTFVSAPNVSATFRLADFGLGDGWDLIPAPSNPTAAATVPAAVSAASPGTVTLSTGDWAAPPIYATHDHQCVLVELDSSDPDVTFINRSVWRNMNFQETNSPFSHEVVVHTKGYELPRGINAHEFILTADGYNTEKEGWQWRIEGAERVDERTYRLRVPAGEQADLRITVEPPDIEIPSRDLRVTPGTGGEQFQTVEVREGGLVTIIADGRLTLGDRMERPVGPNGVSLKRGEGRYLLPTHQSPWSRVGALVGSWDGFKESRFVLGSGRSLRVPRGAEGLSLAINDTREGYETQGGDGFRVQVVETRSRAPYAATSSLVGRDPAYDVAPLPHGINLPSWRMCGVRKTGRELLLGDRVVEVYESSGCFGYMVNRIGQ